MVVCGCSECDDVWEVGVGLVWEIDFFKWLGSIWFVCRVDVMVWWYLFEVVCFVVSVSVVEVYYGIVE